MYKKYKAFLKPLFIGMSCLVAASLLYIAMYIVVEYKHYLGIYQNEQQAEFAIVKNNTQKISAKLKEFLQLTGKRIGASNGDEKRIQSILSSSLRLYEPYELPKVQNLSYYKLSKAPMIVTRLGVLPLEHDYASSQQGTETEPSLAFHKDIIRGKIPVFNEQANIDGFLEIDIVPKDFKALLGNLHTLSFNILPSLQNEDYPLLQREPITVYKKSPQTLWEFTFLSITHYAIFLLYALLLLVILLSYAFYFFHSMKREFKRSTKNLGTKLSDLTVAEEQASQRAILYEQKYKSHQTSSQSHRKIQEALNIRQQDSLLQIHRFLTLLKQSFSHLSPPLSSERQTEIIDSCLQSIHLLSNGCVTNVTKEPVKFSTLLQEIFSLFAEKIYKTNIFLECTCSDQIIFYGDALFTKIILMNVIGKAVHRVTKNEKIFIRVTTQNQFICFNLMDRGFPATSELEHHVKRSFDFVMTEDRLQTMCQDAGMSYTYSRNDEGFNVNEILIPKSSKEGSNSNVAQLFS